MKTSLNLFAAAALAALLAGCATTVEYGDATSSKPIDVGFGSSDLQQIAATMVDSMLMDEVLQDISADGPPLLVVDKVKNKTMQHIDTESVTDSIRTKLIRSRKFSFQDRTTEAALSEELAYQQAAPTELRQDLRQLWDEVAGVIGAPVGCNAAKPMAGRASIGR